MNTKRNTEIEIRGKLSPKNFERVMAVFKKDGKPTNHYLRLSIDLSPGFNPKTRSWGKGSTLDLRLKKSGKSEKISIKIGQFHQKKRKEIEVELKEGEFLNAVELLEILGFNKGMIYFGENWEFDFQGFQVKLSKYTSNYYTWEIESGNPEFNPNELAKYLKLKPYSKKEYTEAINWENKNIHKLFTKNQIKNYLRLF